MNRFSRFVGLESLARLPLVAALMLISIAAVAQKKPSGGTLRINFVNTVNGQPLVLYDSTYTNPFGETYTVTKLRYYISNIKFISNSSVQKEKNSYHLVDIKKQGSGSFSFSVKPGKYTSVEFLLGVDSLRNCSGAQTGALDPMNDMFWTWNTGYVMFKLEGTSASSNQYNNRVEYHIGGYAGPNNVIKKITLPVEVKVKAGRITALLIQTDINKIWQGPQELKIAETPICTTPGTTAKKIAGNYSSMFSIQSVLPK